MIAGPDVQEGKKRMTEQNKEIVSRQNTPRSARWITRTYERTFVHNCSSKLPRTTNNNIDHASLPVVRETPDTTKYRCAAPAKVGAMRGTEVGPDVGKGPDVGNQVSATLGEELGDKLGNALGIIRLGLALDVDVGSALSDELGKLLKADEGLALSDPSGAPLGEELGAMLGAHVGATHGTALVSSSARLKVLRWEQRLARDLERH
jgi:hypothetical protein